jgi:hypothetical protein
MVSPVVAFLTGKVQAAAGRQDPSSVHSLAAQAKAANQASQRADISQPRQKRTDSITSHVYQHDGAHLFGELLTGEPCYGIVTDANLGAASSFLWGWTQSWLLWRCNQCRPLRF